MTKHGHGLPRKRPRRSAKKQIEESLPELEPMDDLPVLEPVDDDLPVLDAIVEDGEPDAPDGPVSVTCEAADEDGFETVVTLDVPDMPKKEVADAVEAPLDHVASHSAAMLRHKKVLVRFTGEGLVGSAVKTLVADKLSPVKPLLVVVRRGFGDEQVHEGSLPTVELESSTADGVTTVQVATGSCEAEDLPAAMATHITELSAAADGGRYVFQFKGGAKPDATMRDAMAMALRDAGARSVAVGARVLFDRDVEDRVKCTVSGNQATVSISLTGDDADAVDALSLVLPGHAGDFDGKNVRFQFARESSAVQSFCVDAARDAGATLIEVGGSADFDIVWPPLISVRAGREVELRLTPSGRSRAAVLSAFERECAEHHDDTSGKAVVIDWPADFTLDEEAIASLDKVVAKLAPKSLCCTVGGDAREPFVPVPVEFSADGDTRVVTVHSEAGKPKELQRAIDRRLPAHAADMRGQAVRIEIVGEAAVSRTLKNALCTAIADAGAMRLELVEGGESDVLLPPLLAITEGDAGIGISCVAGGRDAEQQERAVARELEGVEVALQSVTIAPSDVAEAIATYVMEQGASRVTIDGSESIRLHPPLIESAEKKGREARITIEPAGDDAMERRMLDRELAERLQQLGMLVGNTVTIAWPGADVQADAVGALLSALRDKNASKVMLDSGAGEPVQLHPEVVAEPEPAPEAAAAAAVPDLPAPEAPAAPAAPATPATPATPAPSTPPPVPTGAAPAAVPAGALLSVLGRRDESVPPMLLLGIAAGDDEGHVAAVEAELRSHLPRLRGRAVLLVPQQDGVDVPVRKNNAMVQMLGRVVPTGAAATLVFRGPDAQGRPHFQVMHSNLRALPVGGAFGDPRA